MLGAAIRLLLILLAGFALIMVLFGSGAFRSGLTPATALSFAIFALLAMAPLLARSCLILPAAATGQSARLVDSWRGTQGNALRLTFMLTGLVVLGYFVSFLVATPAGRHIQQPVRRAPQLGAAFGDAARHQPDVAGDQRLHSGGHRPGLSPAGRRARSAGRAAERDG